MGEIAEKLKQLPKEDIELLEGILNTIDSPKPVEGLDKTLIRQSNVNIMIKKTQDYSKKGYDVDHYLKQVADKIRHYNLFGVKII